MQDKKLRFRRQYLNARQRLEGVGADHGRS